MSVLNWPLNWGEWETECVKISNIMRPYLRQSILLVNAGRSIQVQFRSLGTDLRDEKDLKVCVYDLTALGFLISNTQGDRLYFESFESCEEPRSPIRAE
jgi:hypothetical protein